MSIIELKKIFTPKNKEDKVTLTKDGGGISNINKTKVHNFEFTHNTGFFEILDDQIRSLDKKNYHPDKKGFYQNVGRNAQFI